MERLIPKSNTDLPALTNDRQFVRQWTVQLVRPPREIGADRDLNRGQRMYEQALCIHCHRFGDRGRPVGPDLTSVGSRFSQRDILQSIVSPSKVVAEKYRKDVLETVDGKTLIGSVTMAGDYRSPKLRVALDPLRPSKVVEVDKKSIISQTKSNLSQMPEGLLDTFDRDEILDLLAYIASGPGNRGED